MLEGAFFASGAVVGPFPAGGLVGPGQEDFAPAAGGQGEVAVPQVGRLGGAQAGVVEAREVGVQGGCSGLDGREEGPGLVGVDDDSGVDSRRDGSSFHPEARQRVGGQLTQLDGVGQRPGQRGPLAVGRRWGGR